MPPKPKGKPVRGGSKGANPPYGLYVLGALVVLLAALFALRLSTTSHPPKAAAGLIGQPISASLESALARASRQGYTVTSGAVPPLAFKGPLWTKGGRPVVFYAGANYCPFCAAQRWIMVLTLERFGTLTGVRYMRSSSSDVYASTPTFTFQHATFRSPYFLFQPVELYGRNLVNGQYPPLENPTPEELHYLEAYDRPPYAQAAGQIPFVDVANRYIWISASYDPGILDGKSWTTIADALASPHSSTIADAIRGNVNEFTAALCAVDGNEPASVCTVPSIRQLEARLPKA